MSPCEGTNIGLKAHAVGVKPCNTLFHFDRVFSLQSTLKLEHLKQERSSALMKTPVWSPSQTAPFVTKVAGSLFIQAKR